MTELSQVPHERPENRKTHCKLGALATIPHRIRYVNYRPVARSPLGRLHSS
jgi:hypothetical protein